MRLGLGLSLILMAPTWAVAAPAPTVLRVTNPDGSPASPIVVTQTIGKLATPGSSTYRISTNRGSINWKLGTKPIWICANAASGKTPFTLVLTICGPQMPVGISTGTVPVSGTTTGTVPLSAKITVSAAPPPVDPPPIQTGCPGNLLDNAGEKLLDASGSAVTC